MDRAGHYASPPAVSQNSKRVVECEEGGGVGAVAYRFSHGRGGPSGMFLLSALVRACIVLLFSLAKKYFNMEMIVSTPESVNLRVISLWYKEHFFMI
jgi:hypothetical protein